MEWTEFLFALAMFLASHRIPAALGVKSRLVAAWGERGYTVAFSVASLLLLWWVLAAAGRAPFVPIWDQQVWHRWAVNVAMPLAVALTAFGVLAPNPFAFEGRPGGFDPAHPGIAGVTRQPLLWAIALWSGAHLLANGDLAHVILFGSFLGFTLLGLPLADARRRQQMGPETWGRQSRATGLVPGSALVSGKWRMSFRVPLGRLGLTVIGWAVIWHLHETVIGVWPGP